jgi:hypothetical protein
VAFEHEQRRALQLLQGIEQGTLTTAAASSQLEDADPTLVYFIFTWLRQRYAGHAAAEGVMGRLVELGRNPRLTAMVKEGQADSVVTWFEDAYAYRDLDAAQFIEIVVDKLES